MILTNAVLSYTAHIKQELEYLEKYCQDHSDAVPESSLVNNVLKLALEHIEMTQKASLEQQHLLLLNVQNLHSKILNHKKNLTATISRIIIFFEENRQSLTSSGLDEFAFLTDSIEENFVYLPNDEEEKRQEFSSASEFSKDGTEIANYFPGERCSFQDYLILRNQFKGLVQRFSKDEIIAIVSDPILKKSSPTIYGSLGGWVSNQCYIDIARFTSFKVNGKILYSKEVSIDDSQISPGKVLTELAHQLGLNMTLLAFFSPLLTQAIFAHACQALSCGFNRIEEGILVKSPFKSEIELISTSLSYFHFYFRAWFPIVALDESVQESVIAYERYIKLRKSDHLRDGFIEDVYSPVYKSRSLALNCSFNQLRRELEYKVDEQGHPL